MSVRYRSTTGKVIGQVLVASTIRSGVESWFKRPMAGILPQVRRRLGQKEWGYCLSNSTIDTGLSLHVFSFRTFLYEIMNGYQLCRASMLDGKRKNSLVLLTEVKKGNFESIKNIGESTHLPAPPPSWRRFEEFWLLFVTMLLETSSLPFMSEIVFLAALLDLCSSIIWLG